MNHNAATYNRGKCGCPDCCTAHAARVAEQRRRRRERGDRPTEHGTVSTYTNWGCRCDECRAAMRAYHDSRFMQA